MRSLWAIGGVIAVALGAIGIFLPLLPTVPFLLAAAFCFARSSERMHAWLLSHRLFGPPIESWLRSGSINRTAKLLASASMAGSVVVAFSLGFGPAILIPQAVILAAVSVFIWTRPEA